MAYDREKGRKGRGGMKRTDEQLQELLLRKLSKAGRLRRKQLIEAGIAVLGMERGAEYGLEQVYNVIDSRYRSGLPLIVTTNLTLQELQNPPDTPHERIYDRLREMCQPVYFSGENQRKQTAQEKMERLKKLLNEKENCL